MASAVIEVPSRPPKRPTQLRNEKRMLAATIALLEDRTVDEVTSRLIAEASHTNVSYIIRYWGSRDAMLASVADLLCNDVIDLILRRSSHMTDETVLSYFASMREEPEVAIWIKLNRYLAAHPVDNADDVEGATQVKRALETVIGSVLDVSDADAGPMAVLAVTLLLGNEILSPVLGTTDQEFAAALMLATEAIVHRSAMIHDEEDARVEAS